MTRGGKVLSVMLVASLGLWGCARGPVGQSSQTERLRSLESKCAKLENDYRAVAGARDYARKQLAALESERARLQKERDALQKQVDARTSERDNLKLRCDRLKKGLQDLLGQDDALLPAPAAPAAANSNAPPVLPTQS